MKIQFPKSIDEQLAEQGFWQASKIGGDRVDKDMPRLTPELLAHDIFHGLRTLGGNVARDLSYALYQINQDREDHSDNGPAEIYMREMVERDGSRNYIVYYRTKATCRISKDRERK